jgi:hypothetical protein
MKPQQPDFFELSEFWFYDNRTLMLHASGVKCTADDAQRYAEALAKGKRIDVRYVSEHKVGIALGARPSKRFITTESRVCRRRPS